MKKILSLILTLCMCLTMGTVLTACDFGTTDPGHTHTYETVWSHDDTYHWYVCEDKTCVETSQKAEHSIENGVCSVCGYEQSAPTPQPTPSANEVTEEQFNAAFAFEGITSVTVQSESNTNIVNGVQQEVSYATIYLQDNKLKYVSGDVTAYNEVYDTYAYGYSYDTENEKWLRVKIENTDDDFSDLMTFASIKEMFEEVDFSDFVYADGYYTGSQVFEEGTQDEYTVAFRFQFESGRLISARGEYEIEGFDCYDYLSFSAYNETNVSLPANYEDVGSVTPTPDPATSWASYFEFDNVTVTKTSSTYYSDLDMTISDTEHIKVQGNRWLWETTDYYYDDTLYEDFVVYFDGTNAYVYGVVDNEMNTQNVVFFLDADFSAYESSFTETSSGVFEADEISAYGVYTYKDVCITVVNGNISSIVYSKDIAVDGATYTQTTSYSFSSWGETTVDGSDYTEPSAWQSYFDFENVTITQNITYDINGTPQNSDLGTVWRIVGNQWICIRDAASIDGGIIVAQHIAYFDGTNSYLTDFDMTGALVESVASYHYSSEYLMGTLPTLEKHFVKAEQNNQIIYSASSIVLYDVFTYTNVRIIVENNRIVSIEYSVPNMLEAGGEMYPGTYLYEFSDYGTTVIDYTVPDHACHYTEEVATATYLCHSATCETYATYYYSCTCGNKGWNTFYYGEYGECSYGDWHSNNDGTHSKICSHNNSHILTDDCYGGSTTCERPAICEGCGAEHGEIGQHDYSLEVEDNRFLISHCGEYAEYYKSCVCGLRGEEKFFRDAWEICDYGFWVSNGDGTHTRTCSRNASHTETENCSGGSATCINLSVCDYCEAEYGSYTQHYYTYQIITDEYLKSPATCEAKATYHWACEICGDKGDETFEYGKALGCDYGAWKSNGNGTHSRICSRDTSHVETADCSGGTATCTAKARCADCGSEYGEILPHSFVKEVVDEEYLETEATCSTKAVYYKSCECGLYDEETFEYGEFKHTFDQEIVAEKFFVEAATCAHATIYYKSCQCGEKGTETFENGSALEHTYSENWSYDDYYHWHAAICGHNDKLIDKEEHTTNGGKCTVCDYVITTVGLEYSFVNNTYTVVGIGTAADIHHIRVPSNYDDGTNGEYPVTAIGTRAFKDCDNLWSIVVGANVITVGDEAFRDCGNLTSVTISSSVNTIGSLAFYNCYRLSEVVNNGSLDISTGTAANGYMGYYALTVHDGVSEVTQVGDYMFVVGDDNVNYLIGYFGSSDEINLPTAYSGQTYDIKDYAFYGCENLTNVAINDGVINIGAYAFQDCDELLNVVIEGEALTIGNCAFYDCGSLTSVTIGANINDIGRSAFFGCYRLAEVINKSSLVRTLGAGEYDYISFYAVTIHSSTSKIITQDDYKYVVGDDGNYYLIGYFGSRTTLSLPNGFDGENYTIKCYAFYNNDSLVNVSIQGGVAGIDKYAFYDCDGLTGITLPEGVVSVGTSAFKDCYKLANVIINKTVTEIGTYAFSGCVSIKSVEILGDYTTIGANAFDGCSGLASIRIGGYGTKIKGYAFQNCTSLKTVTIEDNVLGIGNAAFYNCNKLESITIPFVGEQKGGGDYYNGTNYRYVFGYIFGYTASAETEISGAVLQCSYQLNYHFYIPASLTSVTVTGGTISYHAFYNCSNIKDVTIANGVTAIYTGAFTNCGSLTSVSIGTGVLEISSAPFYECSSLTQLTYSGSKTLWAAINKSDTWTQNSAITHVICSDGNATV